MKRAIDCQDDAASRQLAITRRSILRALQARTYEERKRRWETMPESWKLDPVVVYTALEHGAATIYGVPAHFYADRVFMLKVITQLRSQDIDAWHILDDSFKVERDFVLAFASRMSSSDVEHVCTLDAKYRKDTEVWIKLAVSGSIESYWDAADPSLRRDHDVAHAWIAKSESAIPVFDKDLFSNIDFLNRVLETPAPNKYRSFDYYKSLIEAIPKNVQAQVADALLTMFEKYLQKMLDTRDSKQKANILFKIIHPSVGTHDRFKLAWFGAGGEFLDEFPKQWKLDEEVFVLLAMNKNIKGALAAIYPTT